MNKIFTGDYAIKKENIKLINPARLQGGTFFSKLKHGDQNIYIQTPICKTKNGIVSTRKERYIDLLFDLEHTDFISFLEDFENTLHQSILEKSESWFENPLSMEDIKYLSTSMLRSYKNSFHLVRVFFPDNNRSSSQSVYLFNENREPISVDSLTSDSKIICLLEITGLKFSTSNFRFELFVKQLMKMNDVKEETCMINLSQTTPTPTTPTKTPAQPTIPTITSINTLEEVKELELSEEEESEEESEEELEEEESEEEVSETEVEEEEEEPTIEFEEVNINVEQEEPTTEEIKEQTKEQTKEVKFEDEEILSEKENEEEEQTNEIDEIDLIIEDTEELPKTILESKVESKVETTLEKNNNEENSYQEHLEKKCNNLEKEVVLNNGLTEVNLDFNECSDSIQLKKKDDIYLELYKAALEKANRAKEFAIKSFLEAKRIKNTYLLKNINSTETDSEIARF